VIARMRARISNIKKLRGERIRKFCLSKLQDENTTYMYVKRLEECLKQSACTGGETIQEEWDLCKKKGTIQQVAEKFWEGRNHGKKMTRTVKGKLKRKMRNN